MTSAMCSSASSLERAASSGIPNWPTVRAIERIRCSCQNRLSDAGAPISRIDTPNTSGSATSCAKSPPPCSRSLASSSRT